MLSTSNQFHFYRSRKMGKCIKTICCATNSHSPEQVGEQDLHEDTDFIQKWPTLLEEIPAVVLEGGTTNKKAIWSEHDASIIAWKSLRSELRKFLYAVSDRIDILVEHLSSINLA